MANTTYDTIKNMKPAPWSRSTVADGNALNQNFLEPTHQKDLTLAAAIDQVKNTVDGYNETINTINGIANNAQNMATEAMTEVTEVSTVVEEHQDAIRALDYNVNSLSSSMVEVVTDINNLENNKQDKIYVDPTTIAGSGTQASPYTVIGGGGGGSNKVYIPEVDEYTGELSYVLSSTSGAQSPLGPWHVKPLIRIATESKEWEISYDGGSTWEDTHVNAEGSPGYSPIFEIETIPESQDPDAEHKNGGTKVTIKYGPGTAETTSYSAWNGNNGSMANAPDIEGTNGLSASFNGSKYFVGLSGEMEVGKIYAVTTSGVEELPIEYSIDGRLCSIGENNKFVYESGGMNDVLLQGYANSGTYDDFVQGYQNSAFQYSIAQGYENSAHFKSFAQGYRNHAGYETHGLAIAQGSENSASYQAFAQGIRNYAYYDSLAQGYQNTATDNSFAQGISNSAYKMSFAQGENNHASMYAFTQGQYNYAYNYAQAIGFRTIASGSVDNNGHICEMMAIGNYNATTAGAAFVIGNGYSQGGTDHRSDAFIVYSNGNVSAIGDIWANGVKLGGNSTVSVTGSVSGDGTAEHPVGLKLSAENALTAVDTKISKPTPKQQQGAYVVWDRGPGQQWSDFGAAANSWASNFLFDEEYPIVNGINGLSAGLVPGEFNDVYNVGIDTTDMDDDKQYAFTTNGWEEVQAGGGTVYDIIGNNGVSAKKDTTNNRYEIGLSANYLQTVSASNGISGNGTTGSPIGLEAGVTQQLSKIDSKTTVTSGTGHNLSFRDGTNSNPTTNFDFSAVDYMRNLSVTAYAPQRLVVVTGDNDIINNHATYSEGIYGTIFFVTSAHA